MSQLHRITTHPEQNGGRPSIRGLRIPVVDILDLLASGASRDEILEDYPYLEAEDIDAAVEFAAQMTDHPTQSAWRGRSWHADFVATCRWRVDPSDRRTSDG